MTLPADNSTSLSSGLTRPLPALPAEPSDGETAPPRSGTPVPADGSLPDSLAEALRLQRLLEQTILELERIRNQPDEADEPTDEPVAPPASHRMNFREVFLWLVGGAIGAVLGVGLSHFIDLLRSAFACL